LIYHIAKLLEMKSSKVTDPIEWLARGPNKVGRRFKAYTIGGVRFHVKEIEDKRKTQTSGVVVTKTSFVDGDVVYYGVLNDIIELNYYERFKVMLFKCDWVDVEQGKGVKKDPFGCTLMNLTKLVHTGAKLTDKPFVLASQVKQVFYVRDSSQLEWHVVVKTNPRDVYEMGDELSFESNSQHQFDDNENMEESNVGIEEVIWVRNDLDGRDVAFEENVEYHSSSGEEW
jgi:hypothetical protein